jgi:uncharacterized beta-barrel protein YwiB (DUF1934 family)
MAVKLKKKKYACIFHGKTELKLRFYQKKTNYNFTHYYNIQWEDKFLLLEIEKKQMHHEFI